MVRMGAMILAAVLLAKDGEVQGRVVKVEESKLDNGGAKIVVVLRTEKGEVRLHVPFGRTEEGWGIDAKLAAQTRELEPGVLVAAGYWEGDGVKIIKWIERRKDQDKEEADRRREEEERRKDEEAMRREKEADKKGADKEREAQKRKEEEKRREAEKKEADKKDGEKRKEAEVKERDQKIRGVVKQIRRERSGEGEIVKIAVILKVEKKEFVLWVPYRKVEGRWLLDKEILRKVDSLREGWVVTIGFTVAEEARFIKWIEVNEDGGDERKDAERKEGEKDRR